MRRTILVLAALLLLSVSGSLQAGMCVNGDFETGNLGDNPGWFLGAGNVAIITGDSSGYGTKCLESVCSGVAYSSYYVNSWNTAVGNQQYTWSIDAKGVEGFVDGGDTLGMFRFANADFSSMSYQFMNVAPLTTQWKTFSSTITAPADAAYMDYWLLLSWNGTSTGSLRFDNLGFTAVPEPTSIALLGFGVLSLIKKRK